MESREPMKETIFTDYGIELYRMGGKLFIRYDAGHIVPEMREDEVTEPESLRAQRSERDAYRVLLEVLRRTGLA